MKQVFPLYSGLIRSLLHARTWVRVRQDCPAICLLLPVLIWQLGVLSYEYLVYSAPHVSESKTYLAFVDQSPRYRRPGGMELSLNLLSEFQDLRDGRLYTRGQGFGRWLCRAVHLPWKPLYRANQGSWVLVKIVPRPLTNLLPWSYEGGLHRAGYSGTCNLRYASGVLREDRSRLNIYREKIGSSMRAALGDSEITGLVLSMSIGSRDVLSERTERAFTRTGLAHLLVVSGYQVTLVYHSIRTLLMFLFGLSAWVFSKLPVRSFVAVLALALTLIFVALCGLEMSSLRAAIAVLLVSVAQALDRDASFINSICVSFIALSLFEPGCILNPGVQLTYAALFGIALGDRPGASVIWRYLSVTTTASIFSGIVVACWFETFSIVGLLLNPILGNIAALVSCNFGIIGITAVFSGLDANAWLLKPVWWCLYYFRELILWCASFSWASLELVGTTKWVTIGCGVFFAIHLCSLRLREYLLSRGVWRG